MFLWSLYCRNLTITGLTLPDCLGGAQITNNYGVCVFPFLSLADYGLVLSYILNIALFGQLYMPTFQLQQTKKLLSSSTILVSLSNLCFLYSSNFQDSNLTELVKSSSCFSPLICVSLFFSNCNNKFLDLLLNIFKTNAKMLQQSSDFNPSRKTS